MPKLLQINVVSNVLSTGKITEDIAKVALANGWECYIAYGRMSKPSVSKEIKIGKIFDVYEHYAENKLFDREGLASRTPTRIFIDRITSIKPDVILLHNIHDHYLNYPILFKYLATLSIPIIWVQHDCWAFTGGCMYFDLLNCLEWKINCHKCPDKRALLFQQSERHLDRKRELINAIPNLTIVSVSDWLRDYLKQSIHQHRPIITIHNGIDTSLFKPISEPSPRKFIILGVASVWDKRKGLEDFIKLRNMLSVDYDIILVGLSHKQIKALPQGIIGITRTTNILELVKLYSCSDVFVNPTYSDNFPTTNIEALSCGTPVITYNTGGSPEAIDVETGIVVPQGDVHQLAISIMEIKKKPLSRELCRKRALEYFDKDKCFKRYIDLFNELIKNNKY